MMETDDRKKMIYRYLLGDLPLAQQLSLGEKLFADDETFEQVWAIENELVDRYVRGQLARVEKELFEKHYLLSPVHRERVTFAQALLQAADADTEREKADSKTAHLASLWRPCLTSLRGSALEWIAVAAIVILVAGSIWLFTERARLREQVKGLQEERAVQLEREKELEKEAAREREQSDQLAAELARLPVERPPNSEHTSPQMPPEQVEHLSVVSLSLSPMLMRSDNESPQLKLTKETTLVLLQMKVEAPEAHSFQVSLRTVEGASVWSRDAIKARAQGNKKSSISVTIPAAKLSTGDYILTLSASQTTGEAEEINRYFFTVVKR